MPGDLPDTTEPEAVRGLNAPPLGGIQRLSALDTVRARIALAVELGLLAPGERLPPTDKIAAALGVGDITVRRALASLHADGVLERRRGRTGGTLVAERPVKGTVTEAAAYRAAAADVHRLIDHRLVLECGVAHLAALHAGAPALDDLDRLVAEMDAAESWTEFRRHDERFHLAVAEATGVAFATAPYGAVLQDLYRYYLPYPLDTLRRSNAEHRALVDALRRGDPVDAAEVARRHVDQLHRTMFVGLMDDAGARAGG
ncbi:FadR/GntR family transcriptional regulator [Streptomyces angustmyceticus]|uniref:FadR/GntR family transcriptional regulator n=1 Tax=Streptomyces angustmyceticus TaxID=285578 RepID=UPI00344C228A